MVCSAKWIPATREYVRFLKREAAHRGGAEAPLRLPSTPLEKREVLGLIVQQTYDAEKDDISNLFLSDPVEETEVETVAPSPKKIASADASKRRSESMKGKNKYKRTALHRSRVGKSVKRAWEKKIEGGWIPPPKRCSLCGQTGHNRQTCPLAKDSEKTRHKKPRSFEHRWKIGAANRRLNALKKQEQLANMTKQKTRKVNRCSYCGEVGHNRRRCPKLQIDLAKDAASNATSNESSADAARTPADPSVEIGSQKESAKPLKIREVDDLKSLYTVPVKVDQIWQLALECGLRAYGNGVNRQRMQFTFPTLRDGVTADPMLSPTGDVVRQFRVASLIVEAILKNMKSSPELQGRLDVGILDEDEGTVYWEGKEISALLFAQPQTLDVMISQVMMRRNRAPRLQLLVNPQWQPGQIISDFGFGPLKALRENYVNSFEDVFYMKQISVFSDTVIVMRCYPSLWQVHLVEPSGQIVLVGSTREKPDFEKILALLQDSVTALSRLNWIDRFKTKYIVRQKRISPFPLSLSKAELEACFENVDLSVVDRMKELNASENSVTQFRDSYLLDTDIITGEPVRDIKLDPVKQFASLLGRGN